MLTKIKSYDIIIIWKNNLLRHIRPKQNKT